MTFAASVPRWFNRPDYRGSTAMNQPLKPPMPGFSIDAIRSRLTRKAQIMIGAAVLLGVAGLLAIGRHKHDQLPPSMPAFPTQARAEKAPAKKAEIALAAQMPGSAQLLIPITPASAPVHAASSSANASNAVASALIASASGGSAKAVKVFPGPAGLIAVAYMTADGRSGLAWVDPTRQLVLLGQLLNAQGQSLNSTGSAFVAYAGVPPAPGAVPGADGSPATPILAAAIKGTGVDVAGRGAQVTLYLDPNSPEDRAEYMTLAALASQNKLNLRVVPVAYLRASSLNRAEDILVALSPRDELRKNEINFDTQHKRGGAGKLGNNVQMMSVVDANTQLLASAGQVQTPALFWCNKNGQAQALYGPMNAQALTQLAAQAHTCPGAPQD